MSLVVVVAKTFKAPINYFYLQKSKHLYNKKAFTWLFFPFSNYVFIKNKNFYKIWKKR